MKIDEVIKILENRVLTLTQARQGAVNSGDLNQVNLIDADLISTVNSIEQIKLILHNE